MREVTTSDTNSLTSIIKKYKHLPSITAIKNYMDKLEKPNFSYKEITKSFIVKEIENLNSKKTSQSNNIPTKLMKENSDTFTTRTVEDFNKSMYDGTFPKSFIIPEVIPVYKKDKSYDTNNYRPLSILSNLLKIYQRQMHDEFLRLFLWIFLKLLTVFRMSYC